MVAEMVTEYDLPFVRPVNVVDVVVPFTVLAGLSAGLRVTTYDEIGLPFAAADTQLTWSSLFPGVNTMLPAAPGNPKGVTEFDGAEAKVPVE